MEISLLEKYLDSARGRAIAGLLLIALFSLLYVAVLGVRPLFIPDETRYGEIAREMLVSGDWVVPHLNGLLYFEKPPFGYWLNAVSLALFGDSEFGVRLSSALSTGISALLIFRIGRQYFQSHLVPYLAVFIFLTTMEVQAVGTFGVLDPAFSVALNWGIAVMALSVYRVGTQRMFSLAAAGGLFGIAFLTKGFLALVLPVLVVVPWLLARREYRFLFRHCWITILAAAFVVAPWAIAIYARQPDFWRYFFWVEHVQRFASESAQHKQAFYYFLVLLPALAFPWIFFLPAAIEGLKRKVRFQTVPGVSVLLILWTVVPILFFSIAKGKLATYILPCFVPFSILMAFGLLSLQRQERRLQASLLAAAGTVLLLFVGIVTYIGRSHVFGFLPSEQLKQVALYGAILFAAATFLFGAVARGGVFKMASAGLAMVPFMITLAVAMPESVLKAKAPDRFLRSTVSELPEQTTLVTDGSLVRAMSWATKRSDIYVIESGGETSYGLAAPDAAGRFLGQDELRALIASTSSVLIVCKRKCKSETIAVLPAQVKTTSYGEFHAYYVASGGMGGQQ
jgi:4-amino-4-deoxy-L-arabinose transferase